VDSAPTEAGRVVCAPFRREANDDGTAKILASLRKLPREINRAVKKKL
jgi:hypothetical protein